MLLQRVDDLPSPTLVRHAAFVPPGYASLLFAFLYQDNECPIRTSLFKSFRAWALDALDIVPPLPVTIDLNAPLKVMLISRRPYQRHRKVSRRMSNEREVVTVLRGVPGVVVDLVDLTSVSLVQQISLVAKTDILIGRTTGVHVIGAASHDQQTIMQNHHHHALSMTQGCMARH